MEPNNIIKDKTLYLLDSYGVIYRSYFAFINNPLINKEGRNISSIFGFFRILHSLIKIFNPGYFVAVFDSRTKTFRHEIYPEYKANRQKTPEDLHEQIPVIEEILTAMGIPIIRMDGYEADDIIATFANQCSAVSRPCRIISSDKDLMQLINKTTEMVRSTKTGAWQIIGEEDVKAEWGVSPAVMVDILSLIGDTADNIPGVKGIGEKTAVKLMAEYGSLDGIYSNIDGISGAIGKKLREGKESAYFSKNLIELKERVPLNCPGEEASIANPDFEQGARILIREGAPAVAKLFAPVSDLTRKDSSSGKKIISNPENLKFLEEVSPSIYKENRGDYTGITKMEELKNIVSLALKNKIVAFDTETTGLNPLEAKIVGFSLSLKEGEGFYVPIMLSSLTDQIEHLSWQDCIPVLEEIFSDPEITVIMHNGKFDYRVLVSNGMKIPECKFYDTMVAFWLLSPDRAAYSLDSLAKSYLGLTTIEYDTLVPKGETFDMVPFDKAVLYGGEDSDLCFRFYKYTEPLLKTNKLDSLFYDIEMPLMPVLAMMEQEGVEINPSELKEYSKELETEIKGLENLIYTIAGKSFNISSPKQLQTILFEELKLPTGKKTKTGYSTDSSVLEELAEIHELPREILNYRRLSKLKSTYVDTLPLLCDKNHRIHTSFMQTGTATGRLSSKDPNLQNIPVREKEGRKIRQAFCAGKGKVLISADYSQIELVVLAHLSRDENLMAAFTDGKDVHKRTAMLIFAVEEPDVTPEMRRVAKTINFGVMYGMSAFRLAKELGISRTEAKNFIDSYFRTYRGVREFLDSVILEGEKNGYVSTIMGRKRIITGINSKNKTEKAGAERTAINTPIQGSAADIVKVAMLNLSKAIKKQNLKTKMILQVHDEIIFEAPEEEAERVIPLIREEMENAVKLRIPLKVSIEKGKRWGEFH